jgi:hypothetical protein
MSSSVLTSEILAGKRVTLSPAVKMGKKIIVLRGDLDFFCLAVQFCLPSQTSEGILFQRC